jgi:hypothetical protein
MPRTILVIRLLCGPRRRVRGLGYWSERIAWSLHPPGTLRRPHPFPWSFGPNGPWCQLRDFGPPAVLCQNRGSDDQDAYRPAVRPARAARRTPRSSADRAISRGTGRSRRPGGWRRPSPGPAACWARRSAGIPTPSRSWPRTCWAASGLACWSSPTASSCPGPPPGDFPARKPGEPSVTSVTRRIEFHPLYHWRSPKARPLGRDGKTSGRESLR